MGVGGCEIKTIGYTCRSVVLKVFGPGFNSRRLHQSTREEREMLTCSPRVSIGSVYSHLSSLEPNEALPKAQALIAPPPTRFVALFFGTLMGLPCVA